MLVGVVRIESTGHNLSVKNIGPPGYFEATVGRNTYCMIRPRTHTVPARETNDWGTGP